LSFYSRHILPHVIDLGLRNREASHRRAAWIPRATGEVLEIGIGSGLNLPFYSSEVERVRGVEPSLELQQMARKRVPQKLRVEFFTQPIEKPLAIEAESIDTVVMTWTLCSLPDVKQAFQQIKRVLKENGRLLFIEHGLAPDADVVTWQNRLAPFWKQIAGGCHLNRKIDKLITEAGLQISELDTCYLAGPRPLTYTYQGFARLLAADKLRTELVGLD
jgi:ubiquinone/menaquinone biosynthesis C-methylase UbiE